jgi:hypothetical protein
MTTRISSDGPTSNVNVSPTAVRVTPYPATPFRNVLSATTSAVLNGAEATVRRLPGGELLAAAVRTGNSDGPLPGASMGVSGSMSATDPSTSASNSGSGGSSGIESALAQQSQDTLYYLSLQQRMQDENRYYTTMSNTLKARHDTVKNSISNLR